MLDKKKIQNILICGVGGVGGYFGGILANKINQLGKKEYKTYFLARGPHLEIIKKDGLQLHTSAGEDLICKPNLASNNIDDIPSPDLCLICVKSYDLDELIKGLNKKLSENTIIIPLMNGIDIYERIRRNLKKSIVLPSCVYIGAYVEKPGLVIQTGNPGFFNCGFDPKFPSFKPQVILDFFKEFNIVVNWREDPYPAIWEKYILVASFSLVSAHTAQTMGGIIYDNKSLGMLRKMMKEIILIAEKKNIKFEDNIIDNIIEFCKDYPHVKPSYARDVERKRNNEGDLFGGTIIRLGKEFGIPTPMTNLLYKNV